MSSGTTSLIGAGLDAQASAITNIGFDFWFMASRYTQFSVNEDGILQLGSTVVGTNLYTINTGTTTSPKFAAFNADLRTGTSTGKVHYRLFGTAPNRTLVVEYANMQLFYTSSGSAGAATWQMRLYESTGVVEYVYGGMSVSDITASNRSPSVGFYTGSATGSFASVAYATQTSSTTTPYAANPGIAATGAISALNSSSDGTRRYYKFTPVALAAPTGLNFTNVGAGQMTLNWTDNASNELGYAIYFSTDATNFTILNTYPANTSSVAITGTAPSTTYSWRVYAYRESLSTVLSGSQITNAAISGTKTIGPGGDYTTFSSAINDVNAGPPVRLLST